MKHLALVLLLCGGCGYARLETYSGSMVRQKMAQARHWTHIFQTRDDYYLILDGERKVRVSPDDFNRVREGSVLQ